jgi:hypothetical protein
MRWPGSLTVDAHAAFESSKTWQSEPEAALQLTADRMDRKSFHGCYLNPARVTP